MPVAVKLRTAVFMIRCVACAWPGRVDGIRVSWFLGPPDQGPLRETGGLFAVGALEIDRLHRNGAGGGYCDFNGSFHGFNSDDEFDVRPVGRSV